MHTSAIGPPLVEAGTWPQHVAGATGEASVGSLTAPSSILPGSDPQVRGGRSPVRPGSGPSQAAPVRSREVRPGRWPQVGRYRLVRTYERLSEDIGVSTPGRASIRAFG